MDISSNLVAAGRARAAKAGLSNLRFEEGDASDLKGLKDASFDKQDIFSYAPKSTAAHAYQRLIEEVFAA